ncbi:MAG TPA: acetamidase/formamidase family protein [Gaiellaceae bacterium]|nr:acetamidase/formamidase family protein [Gaiellaceae bacterium]
MTAEATHRIGRDDVVWAFSPDMTPVLEVDPGAIVTLETNDCFTGQIRSEEDLVTEIDLERVNGATGPLAVRGAEPGDSLVVELLQVRPAERGFATLIPGIGQLIEQVRAPLTQVFRVDGDTIHMNDRISFPLRPMVGVIGVATDRDTIHNGFAGEHGGNLDDHLHGPGATVYLPVRQRGGMLAIGDMHASMGDGEVCFTGVEIAGEVTIRVGLLKGRHGTWPVTDLADRWVVHGTAGPDFTEALDRAVEEAARFLVDEWRFTMEEAFVFLSVACDANICQACRPQEFSTIARVAIPKVSAAPRPFRDAADAPTARYGA